MSDDRISPASPRRVTLVLELDVGATPISGALQDDRGRSRSFQGWLDLADLLHQCGEARDIWRVGGEPPAPPAGEPTV
jgi:hypothetical protein